MATTPDLPGNPLAQNIYRLINEQEKLSAEQIQALQVHGLIAVAHELRTANLIALMAHYESGQRTFEDRENAKAVMKSIIERIGEQQ